MNPARSAARHVAGRSLRVTRYQAEAACPIGRGAPVQAHKGATAHRIRRLIARFASFRSGLRRLRAVWRARRDPPRVAAPRPQARGDPLSWLLDVVADAHQAAVARLQPVDGCPFSVASAISRGALLSRC